MNILLVICNVTYTLKCRQYCDVYSDCDRLFLNKLCASKFKKTEISEKSDCVQNLKTDFAEFLLFLVGAPSFSGSKFIEMFCRMSLLRPKTETRISINPGLNPD